MKIAIDNKLNYGAWINASKYLNHDAGVLTANNKNDHLILVSCETIDEGFTPQNPKTPLVVWTKGAIGIRAARKLVRIPNKPILVTLEPHPPSGYKYLKPFVNALPNFQAGEVKPYFVSDISYFGHYKPEYDKFLKPICDAGLNIRIYGEGDCPHYQYVGKIHPGDIRNVYASSGISLDLEGQPDKALAIWSCGGYCLSVEKYKVNTLVEPLFLTSPIYDVDSIIHHLNVNRPIIIEKQRQRILAQHTIVNRLQEIITWTYQ